MSCYSGCATPTVPNVLANKEPTPTTTTTVAHAHGFLAGTGINVLDILFIAAVLFLLGVLLVGAARRRHSH